MHTLQTHKAPTHFCTERTLQMVFLHFSESCPGSVSCSISAMQDPLKLKSSGSRGTVLHGCGTGTVSVIKCMFFPTASGRLRLSKDDGILTFSEVPLPGHPETLRYFHRRLKEESIPSYQDHNSSTNLRLLICQFQPSTHLSRMA